MVNPKFMDDGLPVLGQALEKARWQATVGNVAPLARYVQNAALVFAGVECVLGLIESSDNRQEIHEDGHEVESFFSPAQRAHLLGLTRVAARLMRDDAEAVSEWADEYMLPKQGGHHDG